MAWSGKNSKGFAIGVYVQVSYPNATQATVTAYAQIQGGTYASTYDTDIGVSMYGSHSGSWNTASYGNRGVQNVGSRSITVNRQYGSPINGSVGVRTERLYGGDVAVTSSWSVPALPYQAPANPINVSAARVSDQQIKVSFTAPYTTAAPVAGVWVDRSDDGGSTWRNVATLPGGGNKSWADTGVSAGGYYQYRVMAYSQDRRSSHVSSNPVYTTPPAPSGVLARRDGTNIVLEWGNTATGVEYETQIWDGDRLLATVEAGVSSWVHENPAAASPHSYVLKHVVAGLESAGTNSNTVNLLAPPLAPTNLFPDGGYAPSGDPLQVAWQHNPVDGTPQSKFTIKYRLNNTGSVYTKTLSSSESQFTIPVGNAESAEYWVSTWGEHTTSSPFSNVAAVRLVPRPTVEIIPIAGGVIPGSSGEVRFTADISGRYAWNVTLADLSDGKQARFNGIATTQTVAVPLSGLRNSHEYKLTVTVTTQVDSLPVETSFRVEYPAPATPTVELVWGDLGEVQATVKAGTGSTVPTNHLTIYRLLPDGSRVQVGDQLNDGTTVFDREALLTGAVYVVVATSPDGVTAESDPIEIGANPEPAIFLIWDSGILAIEYNPDIKASYKRDVAIKDYANRALPVARKGKTVYRTHTIQGLLLPVGLGGRPGQIETALSELEDAERVLLKLPQGWNYRGTTSGVSAQYFLWGGWVISFTHTETTTN